MLVLLIAMTINYCYERLIMFLHIYGLFFLLACITSTFGMDKPPVHLGDGVQQSKNALPKNNQFSGQEEEYDREKFWQHALDTIPTVLENSTVEALQLLECVTRDVVVHQGCIEEPKAQRLYEFAVFCQTDDLLLTLHKKQYPLWSILGQCKQAVDTLQGGFITKRDCRFIELLCKAELVGVKHEEAHCIGTSDTCNKCHMRVQRLVQKTVVKRCCSHFMSLAKPFQDSAVCSDCFVRLQDFLYLKTKNLMLAARECKVMPVQQHEKDLLRWAICYTALFKYKQNKKKN